MKPIILVTTIILTMLMMNIQVFSQVQYYQFGTLCQGSVDVGSTYTELNTGGPHNFTVSENNSTIEVSVNSRLRVQTVVSGTGVKFQVRIDGVTTPDYDNNASIRADVLVDFESIFAVFENVSAGSHTVSIWAYAAGGSATGVLVDPGCWGGKIIVKAMSPITSVGPEGLAAPDEYILQQNYPNPFNPSTTIRYSITTPENVSIKIYDIAGKLVNEITREHNQAGEYELIWNGKNNFGERVSSGTYFYQIVAGDYVEAKKMILIK